MDHRAEQIGATAASDRLYPAIEPFQRDLLDTPDGHRIYVEQCGNPAGRPAIVLHGGPGGGCNPAMRRFFDPRIWRVVLFDQRGCGRSRPHAAIKNNTTAHLIDDIDMIADRLGLDPALLFGGSWGSTLALAYAQARPERVSGLVLRGIFLARRDELAWFYGGGAGRFWPDLWDKFRAPIPAEEHGDLIAAYHRRLFSGDPEIEARFALPWVAWENVLAALESGSSGFAAPDYARAFARLENHYFSNDCFLQEGQLLRDRHRIEHLPAIIVQGRYDMVCPPRSAWDLADGWANCDLRMVPASGHAMSEPRVAAGLVRAVADLARREAGGTGGGTAGGTGTAAPF